MEWSEVKRRLKDGTSVQILADLEGVPYKTMYNRIKQHELKDGVVYMKPEQLNARRKKKPEVIELKPEEKKVTYKKPEVIEAPKQKIECREREIIVHNSPEAQKATDEHVRRLQQASDKFSEAMKKVGEKLREAIPIPEVEKIRVIEEKAKEPEEEGGTPEVLSSVADKIINELDERIDLLNDELQKLEDKKIQILYEVGIWHNILKALKRERGEA